MKAPIITSRTDREQVRPGALKLGSGRGIALDRPLVMGVVNATPDSFSDGGAHPDLLAHARRLIDEGADLIDVGGESTRPGAAPVSEEDELRRVLPLIEALAGARVPVSIDTRKAAVARAALRAGAALVNDVSGLADPDMASAVAGADAGLIVGHLRGTPDTMQRDARFADVVGEVEAELRRALERALAFGVRRDALLVDPGLGFGKTLEHNLALLAALPRLASLAPLVVGLSRKASLGALLDGRPVEGRLHGGIGGAVWAALNGASIIRTHDVLPTRDALRVVWAIRRHEGGPLAPLEVPPSQRRRSGSREEVPEEPRGGPRVG